jgi:two-component system, cell cycle response regulator
VARILLVDDEKVACTIYGDFLKGDGHEVAVCVDISAAKSLLETSSFDLVVSDVMFPIGDGLQLLDHVRARFPETEVMVMTALDKVEPAVKAIRSGATDYLLKPVTPLQLKHSVDRALTQQRLKLENASLRHHVLLMESGERMSSTLERDRLQEVAFHVFSRLCGTTRLAIFQGVELLLAPGYSLPFPEWVQQLETQFRTQAKFSGAPGKPSDALLTVGPASELALRIPLKIQDQESGTLFAFVPRKPSHETHNDLIVLSRHLAAGLKNLGHLHAVESLVYLDDLTRLFNSRYLELMIDRECKAVAEGGKHFAVLFLDLDGLKAINDAHGHLVGSQLLSEVARVLKHCIRDTDVASRWGGDEFVILLRGTDIEGALVVAERIRMRIEKQPFLARERKPVSVTVSIGLASCPQHAPNRPELMKAADEAMYMAKRRSKNATVIYGI